MAAAGPVPSGRDDRRVPVVLLTGFLGAGKTTLLNHLLGLPEFARTAVLINEFGAVGVDHHLVDKIDETLLVLDSGCICCSVQGDLVRALKNLFARAARREIGPVDRVLIETTGMADPAPVIHTLTEDAFIGDRFRCDGVVTAVDATHGGGQIDAHREALRQVVMADRLLITKCDLAPADERARLAERLARLNPGAAQIEVFHGQPPAGAIASCGLYDTSAKSPDVALWLGEERALAELGRIQAAAAAPLWRRSPGVPPAAPRRHDASVTTFVLRFDQPLDWLGFCDGLGLLLEVFGERILRIKGLLNIAGDPQPRVVQCVQHVAYPPTSLAAWPDDGPYADRLSRLVFIVRELQADAVADLLGGLAGQPASIVLASR